MAENYPIDERIVQAVETALKRISQANGYANDIAEVTRPRRTGEMFSPKDMGIALRVIATEPTGQGEVGPAAAWRVMTLAADVCVRLSEQDDRPMDQVLSIVKADVIKAAMNERTWGGLAMDTRVGEESYYADTSGFEGVIVELEIEYATALNDMYVNMI